MLSHAVWRRSEFGVAAGGKVRMPEKAIFCRLRQLPSLVVKV
jgi:hypothetical protein